MRISISIKLFFSFLLVLALSIIPAFWYLQRTLLSQVVRSVEQQETDQASSAARTPPTSGTAAESRPAVQLAKPLGEIQTSFAGATRFLRRTAGVVGSLVLLLSLLVAIYGVRPLTRLQLAAQAYAHGDYSYPLDTSRRDELGDLARAMVELSQRTQAELSRHGADRALRAGLVRALPLPTLLVGPDLEREEINPPFRDATEINAESEEQRLRELFATPAVVAARTAAAQGEPQPLQLSLPWRRGSLRALLCPLRTERGGVSWVLFLTDPPYPEARDWHDPLTEAKSRGLVELDRLTRELAKLVATTPTLAARLCELRAASDLLRGSAIPSPTHAIAVELQPLLTHLQRELLPLCHERGVALELALPDEPLRIGDAQDFVLRALRGLLSRALLAAPQKSGSPTLLRLRAEPEERAVRLELSGLPPGLYVDDLDQLLATLGGGILSGATADPALPVERRESADAQTLQVRLRRA